MEIENGTRMENGTKKVDEIRSASFEEAMSLTGFGKFNIWVLLVSGICLITVITETTGMGFILPAAQCDLNLSLGQKGLLTAISYIGIMSSSHLWGFLADTQGRRVVLLWALVLAFLMSVISSFAKSLWIFILLRFCNGFLMAAPSATVYVFLGEFHSDNTRARMMTLCASLITLGSVYVPAMSWLIVPMDWELDIEWLGIIYRPWRLQIVAFSIPGIICFLGLLLTPESPKYLMSQGETEKSLDVLKTIYAWNTGNEKDAYPIKRIDASEADANFCLPKGDKSLKSILKFIWSQTGPIFWPPYATKTFMLCLIQFGAFFVSGGLYLWYPAILNRMLNMMSSNSNETLSLCNMISAIDVTEPEEIFYENATSIVTDTNFVCNDTVNVEVFQITLAMGVIIAIIYSSIAALMTWVGNKTILVTVLLTSSIAGILVYTVENPVLVMVLLVVFLLCSIAIGVTNTFTVDIYPTYYRGMAMSMSLMAGRFGAVSGTNAAGYMLEYFCNYTFYLYGGLLILCAFTAYRLPSSKKKENTSL